MNITFLDDVCLACFQKHSVPVGVFACRVWPFGTTDANKPGACTHANGPRAVSPTVSPTITPRPAGTWNMLQNASRHLHFLPLPLLGWVLTRKRRNSQTPLEINTLLFALEEILEGTLLCFHFAFFRLWRLDGKFLHGFQPQNLVVFSPHNIPPAHEYLFSCSTVGDITHCKFISMWPSPYQSGWLPWARGGSPHRVVFSETWLSTGNTSWTCCFWKLFWTHFKMGWNHIFSPKDRKKKITTWPFSR